MTKTARDAGSMACADAPDRGPFLWKWPLLRSVMQRSIQPTQATCAVPPQLCAGCSTSRLDRGRDTCGAPPQQDAAEPASMIVRLVTLLVALFMFALAFLQVLPARTAFAQTAQVSSQQPNHPMYSVDSTGAHVRDFNEPTGYVDGLGNTYRCVDPFALFQAGTFTEESILSHLSLEQVNRCGIAELWCSQNVPSGYAGPVAQIFVWKILSADGRFASYRTVDWKMVNYDADAAYTRFLEWYATNGFRYIGHGTYWTSGSSQAVARFWAEESVGTLSLRKRSALTQLTAGNGAYSLAGAHYSVWRDEGCTQSAGVAALVTNDTGVSNAVELTAGTYWIREDTPPQGYAPDTTAHKVTVRAGNNNSCSIEEQPLYEAPSLLASKVDNETGTVAQGSATLADAEVTVRYYDGIYQSADELPAHPTRSWVLKTDPQGLVMVSDDAKVSGSDFYRVNESIVVPRGTLSIQETKAPKGYLLEGQTSESDEAYTAPIHLAHVTGEGSFTTVMIADQVARAGIKLQKEDEETGPQAQGDATLGGVEFEVVNRNDTVVSVDGTSYAPGDVIGSRLVTDAMGFATTSADYLPVGSYEVREMGANGSLICGEQFFVVTLTDSDAHTIVPLPTSFCDKVTRGGMRLCKVSRETMDATPQGASSLRGAEVSVSLLSDQPVVVDGALYEPGETVCVLVTDEQGMASTNADTLPYGTYLLQETRAPQGFVLNEDWEQVVRIRENGVIVDLGYADNVLDEQVIRSDFFFTKVEEGTMERLAGIPFLVTSVTTGESHVVVSDDNGTVSTGTQPHTYLTNANDLAVGTDNKVDESLLNPHAGMWFKGGDNLLVTPNDNQGALPYDTYTIEELPVVANEGKRLVSFSFHVNQHDNPLDMGTVLNKDAPVVGLETSLTYAGDLHVAPALERCVLVDTVSYANLEVGQSYTLTGRLMRADSAQAEGADPLDTKTVTFVPTMPTGTIEVSFEVDTRQLVGNTLVSLESLSQGNKPVASHEDWDDERQTVRIPSLGTSLADENGTKEIDSHGRVTLVDHVSYAGLQPQRSYRLKGTLMDKATGKPLEDNGEQVTCTATFVADASRGTTDVRFSVAESLVSGKTVVAFEQLETAGVTLATHDDLNDAEQKVCFPHLRTELSDAEGHHLVAPTSNLTLVDTVAYAGLIPGTTYQLQGQLMDKDTGTPLGTGHEEDLKATVSFVAEKESGTTTVTFAARGDLLAGKVVVAVETLFCDGHVVVTHDDMADEAQTVYIPAVQTVMTSSHGTHVLGTSKVETLTDVVTYEGVRPDVPYTLVGTLVNANTGEALRAADGSLMRSTREFVPTSSAGTAEVSFGVDASQRAGMRIVAFEELHEGRGENARTVAQHADTANAQQTVAVPSLATTATNARDNSKQIPATGTVRIRDTVTYTNLTAGETYVMHGTIHSKKTGHAATDKDGLPLEAEESFVAQPGKGTVELVFELDAARIEGTELVVFESCLHQGHEIASHADINDKDQTILLKAQDSEPTPKTTIDTSQDTPKSSKQAILVDDTHAAQTTTSKASNATMTDVTTSTGSATTTQASASTVTPSDEPTPKTGDGSFGPAALVALGCLLLMAGKAMRVMREHVARH